MLRKCIQSMKRLLMRPLPFAGINFFRHHYHRCLYHAHMRKKLGHRYASASPGPMSPVGIIETTSLMKPEDIVLRNNKHAYFASGYLNMRRWLAVLEKHGFNIRTARAIMEFGCGSARLIRHLRCIDGVELKGTDIDSSAISWCREHLPGIAFHVNELVPPLTFAKGDEFDLVFAQSVFTHIPPEHQGPWIEELYRVTRKGGFVMVNVLGPAHQSEMLDQADLEKLRMKGQVVLGASHPRASYSTKLTNTWDVFQTRDVVFNEFSKYFFIHEYLAQRLDLLIMQKRSA